METVRPGIRIPKDLYEAIRYYAFEHRISINVAIVTFLRRGWEMEAKSSNKPGLP